jgi:hypothetical protein
MSGRESTRTSPAGRNNGQYRYIGAKAADNKTQDECAGPLEYVPAVPGVPPHIAYFDNGNQPPPKNAGH